MNKHQANWPGSPVILIMQNSKYFAFLSEEDKAETFKMSENIHKHGDGEKLNIQEYYNYGSLSHLIGKLFLTFVRNNEYAQK